MIFKFDLGYDRVIFDSIISLGLKQILIICFPFIISAKFEQINYWNIMKNVFLPKMWCKRFVQTLWCISDCAGRWPLLIFKFKSRSISFACILAIHNVTILPIMKACATYNVYPNEGHKCKSLTVPLSDFKGLLTDA